MMVMSPVTLAILSPFTFPQEIASVSGAPLRLPSSGVAEEICIAASNPSLRVFTS